MKKFIITTILALLALTLLPKANAQSQTLGAAPTIAAATTATVGSNNVVTCSKQQNVMLQFNYRLSAAGVSNVVYNFSRSVDGINYDTVTKYALTTVATGTSTNTIVTNLNVGGAMYLRLESIDNYNATGVLTNYSIKYSVKPNAP